MRYINLFLSILLLATAKPTVAQQTPDSCLSAFTFRIVVIGSSTAAGAGASPADSAWVNRYTDALKKINPANQVLNLARGGYNTYHLMPSDTVPPSGRPMPDTLRNITKALSLQPDAIIINLPSNDAAAGYALEEQLKNFDVMVQTADAANVPIWVCTTQPRNFSASQILIQLAARDSILSKYGDQTINVWDAFATPDGMIDQQFDSGDGIHLNNHGHRIFFKQVQTKAIPVAIAILPELLVFDDTLCGPATTTLHAISQNADTILWFSQPQNGSPIGTGPAFTTPVLDSSTTYYAEAQLGPFDYTSQLFTTNTTNRDWNGIMFELRADTLLTIDSLSLRIQTSGNQNIRALTRTGSLLGWENTPDAWTLLDSFPLDISAAGDIVSLPVGPLELNKGDTISIYLHLDDPLSNLAYFAPDDTQNIYTPELSLQNSTGISYGFSQSYFPRLYSGRVYYHFGFKPGGSCRTARLPVNIQLAKPSVDLGPDSLSLVGDSLEFDAGAGYLFYLWSDGSTKQSLSLSSNTLQSGANRISVLVTDSLGCTATDSVTVYYFPTSTNTLNDSTQIQIRPNPGQTTFLVLAHPPLADVQLEIYDSTGQQVYQTKSALPKKLESNFGPAGIYWIRIQGPSFLQIIKWIKID